MADVAPRGTRRDLVKLGVLAALVVGGVLVARFTPVGDYLSREGIGRVIALLRRSAWAPLIFVAIYAGATAVAVPGTVLTLAGGALFGTLWGTVLNSVGANLGANAAFLISRSLGRGGVERLLGDRLEKLDRATRDYGFRGLLALRLVPVMPFNALNFGSGLTAISWPAYALATLVGILPGTIVYTMFADALLQGSQEASREALVKLLVSGGLLVLLSLLPAILKKLNVKLPGRGTGPAVVVLALALAASGAAGGEPAPRGVQGSLPDHGDFTLFLREVVEGDRVDYRAVQEHRGELDRYLGELAGADSASLAAAGRDARLAFWIDAYNACMLKLVADHYPLRENASFLQRVKATFTGRPSNSVWLIEDVFTREHCRVAGELRSQDEIEHEILRPMGDPRIHFAINCAAVSCPALAPEAYTADAVDAQLDRQVERFLGDPDQFQIVRKDRGDAIRVNRVLDWFGEDFGGAEGVKEFLARYLSGERRDRVARPSTEVEFFDYDWTLNDVEG